MKDLGFPIDENSQVIVLENPEENAKAHKKQSFTLIKLGLSEWRMDGAKSSHWNMGQLTSL